MNTQLQKKFKILLIGDDCIDEYWYGSVDRISPEAPVPIFRSENIITRSGMAANVCANLENLGCQVIYVHGQTSRKTRLIDMRSRQHMIRMDNDQQSQNITIEDLKIDLSGLDAIVISDYAKGTVSYELIETLRRRFHGPIFVDTKKTDLARLEGCIVKINRIESEMVKTRCTDLIVTLGSDGARYLDRLFPARPIEVVDVCGAGDTFLASLCYSYVKSGDIMSAIEFALAASAVTVQHHGVYAPTLEEIK
jgi:D-glycero-beta-D-manno-heptose-7-phosphate kinase